LVLRARTTVFVLIGTACIIVALLVPRTVSNDQPSAGGQTITIFSANLLRGEADPDALAKMIDAVNPDIIALQEVVPQNVVDLRARGALRQLPYSAGTPEIGTLGYVTLSKFPLRVVPDSGLTNGRWPEMRVGSTGMIFRNVHPGSPLKPQISPYWQQNLRDMPSAGEKLRVIAGDFNATLDHRDFRAVLARGYRDAGDQTGNGFKWTWSVSRMGRLVIDHVLVPRGVAIKSYRVMNVPGSDHNALAVTLQLPR
jgi:endonuclease/exonuclease/phosphatase family metal-dependent hydrolase